MSNILIVGGGFAGAWSAAAAVRLRRASGATETDLSVTLVSAGDLRRADFRVSSRRPVESQPVQSQPA